MPWIHGDSSISPHMRLSCQKSLQIFLCLLFLTLWSGCERPPTSPSPRAETPPPAVSAPTPRHDSPGEVKTTVVPPAPPEETARPASELAQRLRSAEEPEERSEVVSELWSLATPEAVEILRRQFFTERDVNVKADIVAGLVDEQKPETRELRFGILAAALPAGQPDDVRAAAIAIGTEFDDIRAVALLQSLLQDPSEEIREAAQEALETRREKE